MQMVGSPWSHEVLKAQGVNVVFRMRSSAPKGDHLASVARESFYVKALRNVDFQVLEGESVSLVGGSGSGKSTLAKVFLGFLRPKEGSVAYLGNDIYRLKGRRMREFRINVQPIFQDPYNSLNPARKVSHSVQLGLFLHEMSKEQKEERVARTLEMVGLTPVDLFLDKYPHQLSGGQRQRAAIARAFIGQPKVIIADEPVSMLDASVRADILNLILKMKQSKNTTFLYITHDLATARYLTERMAVMEQGEIVELGKTEDIIESPAHEYTMRLMNAVPDIWHHGSRAPDRPVVPPRFGVDSDGEKDETSGYVDLGNGHYVKRG